MHWVLPTAKLVSKNEGAVLARDIALDLGTATVQVYVRDRGVVVEEPSVVAVERRSGDVVDAGRSALYLAEESPDRFDLKWPVRHGVAEDAALVQRLVAKLIRPLTGGFMERTRVIVAVPSATSPLERRVVREACKRAGASTVHLIEHVMAAALGGDLPVHEPIGTMVVDVGAGISEAALISVGAIVGSSSVRAGGGDVDRAIKAILRREYGLIITDNTAEHIKLAIGADVGTGQSVMVEARGERAVDGSVMTAILERDEVQSVVDDHIAGAIESVRACLVQAPPELAQDLFSRGVYLSGGGALLGGLASRISSEFALPVHVMVDPDRAVIMGTGKCLEAMESLQKLFIGERA
jgi:rod shape-determining protein MreB and related proteins